MVDAPPARTSVVFVSEAVDVARPRSLVERQLCVGSTGLLPLAADATGDGEGQVVRVGPVVAGRLLGVPVKVLLAPCRTRDGATAIPIRWEAVTLESLLPVLDGTLLLSAIEEGRRCRLAIEASYRVPFERLGDLLDRALLHHVAEATVRSFLERLSDAMTKAS